MEYFKIDGIDFSMYIKELNISKESNYNAQTNAAGDTVVDYINAKRTIEVVVIPLEAADMAIILNAVEPFNVSISFRNPLTNQLEEVNCIIPSTDIEYYTIQVNKVMYNEMTLTFTEL